MYIYSVYIYSVYIYVYVYIYVCVIYMHVLYIYINIIVYTKLYYIIIHCFRLKAQSQIHTSPLSSALRDAPDTLPTHHSRACQPWLVPKKKPKRVAPEARYIPYDNDMNENHRKTIGKRLGDSEISLHGAGIFTYKTGWFKKGKCW